MCMYYVLQVVVSTLGVRERTRAATKKRLPHAGEVAGVVLTSTHRHNLVTGQAPITLE